MATRTLATDPFTEDLILVDGVNIGTYTGLQAVTQSVRQATKMRLGEDLYNQQNGVDFLGTIFSSGADTDKFRASLTAAIAASPDVTGVDSINISGVNPANSTVVFTAYVHSLYGTANVSA